MSRSLIGVGSLKVKKIETDQGREEGRKAQKAERTVLRERERESE